MRTSSSSQGGLGEAERRSPRFIDVGKRVLKIIDPWPGRTYFVRLRPYPITLIDNTASPYAVLL